MEHEIDWKNKVCEEYSLDTGKLTWAEMLSCQGIRSIDVAVRRYHMAECSLISATTTFLLLLLANNSTTTLLGSLDCIDGEGGIFLFQKFADSSTPVEPGCCDSCFFLTFIFSSS